MITDPPPISSTTLSKKKTKKKCDLWHMTRDTWHVTRLGGGEHCLKSQLPSSYRLWFMILWRSGGKGWIAELINEWMTRLFIEQPRLHRVVNYYSGRKAALIMTCLFLWEHLSKKHKFWKFWNSTGNFVLFPEKLWIRKVSQILGAGDSSGWR